MGKVTKTEIYSPCRDCPDLKNFSFRGCMEKCEKFMAHLIEVAKKKDSPCRNFRCGVPGVNNLRRGKCNNCPIREAYAQGLGDPKDKRRCVLGTKEENVYLSPWELRFR